MITLQEWGATHDGLRSTFEDLVADILEKSCTPPSVPTNPKNTGHLGVSTSRELNLNLQLCSRLEKAFVRVETTLSTQVYMC